MQMISTLDRTWRSIGINTALDSVSTTIDFPAWSLESISYIARKRKCGIGFSFRLPHLEWVSVPWITIDFCSLDQNRFRVFGFRLKEKKIWYGMVCLKAFPFQFQVPKIYFSISVFQFWRHIIWTFETTNKVRHKLSQCYKLSTPWEIGTFMSTIFHISMYFWIWEGLEGWTTW